MPPAAKVYTIRADAPFLSHLARGLLDLVAADPRELAGITVLLPTRRACRALAETFLRLRDGKPTLLPTLRPLGDVDEDEIVFEAYEDGETFDIPPAISTLRRRLLLALLVRARSPELDAAQAVRLAVDLAELLDALQREDLTLDDLQGITPEAFAQHWQQTLSFLQVLAEPWRELLAAEQMIDPVARRSLLLRRLAKSWRSIPPEGPVIAAGSTGSIPATAELLQVVATLPQGSVVLPGLDQDMDDSGWAALDPGHPQFGLKQLLEVLAVERDRVESWPGMISGPGARPARLYLLSEAMRPAATTERWRELEPSPPDALAGLSRIDCTGPREEALAIALLMREAVEVPDATAALVTPDRKLARRVAIELGRWGIAIDDSAGRPLGSTPPGTLLRLSAAAFAEALAPIPLLAMLKHPLAAGGDQAAAFNADVRLMDRLCLRGPRPAPGFDGLLAAIKAGDAPERVFDRMAGIAEAAAPYLRLLEAPEMPLTELLAAHVAFAEWLSRDDAGIAQLWHGDDGEMLARFVHDLHESAAKSADIDPASYPELLYAMMAGEVVRPRYGRHPRLFIWGPLEARLQHADVMILGGLNEGTWPAESLIDPWLSRPMRRQVGLPSPERRIGLAAHDFTQAASAPRVVLTRSGKVDGTPTVPSRWLLRLDNVFKAQGLAWSGQRSDLAMDWAAILDRPERYEPTLPPAFAPPLASRPKRLSVTRIETWMRDPYSIYARYILNLVPLDPLQADPGAAERGIAIHHALDRFVAANPDELPGDAYQQLLSLGREAFAEMLERPGVMAFWWPRFERIAKWFLETESARRTHARPLVTEAKGRLLLPRESGAFTLTAHADRIDRFGDGSLAIIDYKTGALPSEAEILRGDAPQLPLEAAIALAGGFADVSPAAVSELSFWKLSGGRVPGEIRRLKVDAGEAAAIAKAGLERLIASFEDPATPYRARPRPSAAARYGDYDHLARTKAWSVVAPGSGK